MTNTDSGCRTRRGGIGGTTAWRGSPTRIGSPTARTCGSCDWACRSPSRGPAVGESHRAHAFAARRPHVVSLSKEGLPRRTGTYATSKDDIQALIGTELPEQTQEWKKRRILIYAPSGLVDEKTSLQRFDAWRDKLLQAQIYPLLLNWETEFAPALGGLLEQAKQGLAAHSPGHGGKDAAANRLDEAIEPVLRREGGERLWSALKDHAAHATNAETGGAHLVAQQLAALAGKLPNVEIHLLGHGLGALLIAGLAPLLTGKGRGAKVASCTLWAPACTIERFEETLAPRLGDGSIGRFALATLPDSAEKNDTCAGIYNKSLLYLVANALEKTPRVLGLEAAVKADRAMTKLLRSGRNEWIVASGAAETSGRPRSSAQHHDDFAGDAPTLATTADFILGSGGDK